MNTTTDTPTLDELIKFRRRRTGKGRCPLCRRDTVLTFHHLIPKKLHRRTHFRKKYDRETLNLGIEICRQCHSGIHLRQSEMELYKNFSTPDALLKDPDLKAFFAWVARQKIR